MFPFDPPENIRKPLFSGGSKGNIGKERVNLTGRNGSYKSYFQSNGVTKLFDFIKIIRALLLFSAGKQSSRIAISQDFEKMLNWRFSQVITENNCSGKVFGVYFHKSNRQIPFTFTKIFLKYSRIFFSELEPFTPKCSCSEKFHNMQRKTPQSVSLLNKIEGCMLQHYWKETPTQLFSYIAKFFRTAFSRKHVNSCFYSDASEIIVEYITLFKIP